MTANEIRERLGRGQASVDLTKAAASYVELRRRRDVAETTLREITIQIRQAEEEVFRQMDQSGHRKVAVAGFTLASVQKTYYRLAPEALDQPQTLVWLKRQGGHDLLQKRLDERAFSKFCRQLAESGKPILAAVRQVTVRSLQVTEGTDLGR